MSAPYLQRYRNAEYIQFMADVLNLLGQQDVVALQLSEQKDSLDMIMKSIESAFKQNQGSKMTQEIIALDERRDRAIIGLRGITNIYKNHFNQNIVNAANLLHTNIATHGNRIQSMSYQEETAIITSIVNDWLSKDELKVAVAILGLGDWLAELKDSNEQFSKMYVNRVIETAQKPKVDISKLRNNATQTYRVLMKHIKAFQTLTNKEEYTIILNRIDKLAGQYNQIIENRISDKSNK